MRLISCHVENFGKVSDFSFDFNPGVNNIVQDNGWGKSTLAAFIRVMFFGFDREEKRGELQNERKRFTPWQSGVYGGEIVFEQNGKNYRIKRTFAAKKGESDNFSVTELDSDKAAKEFSENIGEELFGIDAESFEKTVFVAQQDCNTTLTDSIHAKIGDIEGQTAGMGNFKSVMKNLKAEKDRIDPSKKGNYYSDLKAELSDLEKEIKNKDTVIKNKNNLEKDLENCNKELINCREDQKNIQEKLSELSRLNDLRVTNEKYKSLLDNEEKTKKIWNDIASGFPGKAPVQSEIDENMDRANKLKALELSLSSSGLNDEQSARLKALEKEFSVGVPDDEDLKIASSLIHGINTQKNRTEAAMLSLSEASELERYKEKFAEHIPDEEEISSLKEIWRKRSELKNEITLIKGRAAAIKSSPLPEDFSRANASTIPRKMLMTGIIFLLIAFVISLLKAPIGIAIGVAALGAGLVGFSFLIGRRDEQYEANRKILAEKERKEDLERTLAELSSKENTAKELFSKVEAFLTEMNGTFNEGTVPEDLINLLSEAEIYKSLKAREENYDTEKNLLESDDSERKIRAFFHQYMPLSNNDYSAMLQTLNFDKKEYLQLKDIAEHKADNAEIYEIERKKLSDFLKSVGFDDEENDISVQINRMRDRFHELQKANMDYNSARTDRQIFESSHDIEALKEVSNYRFDKDAMEKLSRKFDESETKKETLTADIKKFENDIAETEKKLEELAAAEAEFADKEAKANELKHKFDILSKTETYLKNARDSFADKYMSPIRLAYDKYYSLLSDDEKEYELDTNLNITFREYNKNHESGFLSEGYKDLVGLCRRMAMIDAMYKDEKPFVILDDPFVNLDDTRIEGAKDFLNKISSDYQIIYFTCNQYRVATA
ncbi:ATP-binding protein [Lachnospiraceae bacterium C1.1]|nr:AAA family ATPase [Lachnospiraceae bacterium C1.1]